MTEVQRDELVKGVIHLGGFGFVSMCFGHNLKEFCKQPNRQNAVNALVYGCALGFEGYHVVGHLRAAAHPDV